MVTRSPLLLAVALAISVGLAGCETSDVMDSVSEKMHDFNPFGTAKKKLAGERQEVFPQGVPGVQQGIPPELMPGGAETATAAPEPAPEPKVVERKRRKPAPRRAASRESAPPKRAARQPRPAPQQEPSAAQEAAKPTPAQRRSAWDTVPTTGSAPTQPQGKTAPSGQSGWMPPASQPVPTQWPDPPKAGQ
jgi:hypothetical protein